MRPGPQAARPAAPALDDEFKALLDGLVHDAADAPPARVSPALRRRLFARVARSAAASRTLHTVRAAESPLTAVAPGVQLRTLYRADGRAALRRGEPLAVAWVELAPGARWQGPAPAAGATACELLVVNGGVSVGGIAMGPLEHRVVAGATGEVTSRAGATLCVRLSRNDVGAETERPDTGWTDFAPGIERRLLWARAGMAAMLYRAAAGATVPCHRHGHDEECLMLDGDLFIDDVLLRRGEYQLAPAGSVHAGLYTDTGAVLYAHGDIDLDVVAG